MENYLIIGGDKRQKVLYDRLKARGKNAVYVTSSDFGNIASYSYIILPVPVSKDNENIYCSKADFVISLSELEEKLTPLQTVFGGGFPENFKNQLDKKGVKSFDFMTDESFVTANAYLTAQGTLRLVLENTEEYIIGKKMLIIGFGRVAKAVASIMKGIGADVYIAARNFSQLKLAELCAYKKVNLSDMSGCLSDFSYIFGTVPSNVLTEDNIKFIRDDCIYFELASAPFTADKNAFERYGKRYILGGALPGKFLPVASGNLLFEYIMRFTSENKE